MKKNSFWSGKSGKMSIAFFVLLLAFPVSLVGLSCGIDAVLYLGLAMIWGALASSPIMTLTARLKKK